MGVVWYLDRSVACAGYQLPAGRVEHHAGYVLLVVRLHDGEGFDAGAQVPDRDGGIIGCRGDLLRSTGKKNRGKMIEENVTGPVFGPVTSV